MWPPKVHYHIHQSPDPEPNESSSRSSAQISQQSGIHLKILGTWRVTRRHFFAMATWGFEICASLSSRNFFQVLQGQFLYYRPICINVFPVICHFKIPHQHLLDHFSHSYHTPRTSFPCPHTTVRRTVQIIKFLTM